MEIKDIVDKALKGEDYAEETKDFDGEKLKTLDVEIAKAWKAEGEKAKSETIAFRKEKARLEGKTEPDKKDEPQSQLRTENIELAKEKFFANPRFKLSDDQKVQFEAEFKRLDTGKIAPELISKDLEKAYAVVNSENLLKSQDRVSEFEKNAAQYNADNAGGSAGTGSPDDSKYSQAAKDLHAKWVKSGIKNKSLDEAQRVTNRGENWKGRDLSS